MAPEDTPPDVLSSLPHTRPQRRSAKRGAPGTTAAKKPPATKTTARKPAARKAAAKPRAAAARPKARPQPAVPSIPPAGFAVPQDAETRPAPSPGEIVGTAVQAASELAQIGLAVGGQALRSALGRLGRS